MSMARWDKRFFQSTRGQVLRLIRRGPRTVDELAAAVGVSDNAVRAHLAGLERDGMVQQRGVRPTGPAGGKPAFDYELAPEAERYFTRAYAPVLTHLVGVLADRMSPDALSALLREVGERLATTAPPVGGCIRARAEAAANLLTELGGIVELEEADGTIVLRGYSCPLADAVRAHPATCEATESLVAALVGVPVREHCDKGERPRCRFELSATAV